MASSPPRQLSYARLRPAVYVNHTEITFNKIVRKSKNTQTKKFAKNTISKIFKIAFAGP
jgi:hypothetical protein